MTNQRPDLGSSGNGHLADTVPPTVFHPDGLGGIFNPKMISKSRQNSEVDNVVLTVKWTPLPLNLKFPPKVKGSG